MQRGYEMSIAKSAYKRAKNRWQEGTDEYPKERLRELFNSFEEYWQEYCIPAIKEGLTDKRIEEVINDDNL